MRRRTQKSCIYQCKDTNFKANHNFYYYNAKIQLVVFTNAKILILKLITTRVTSSARTVSCIYQCKDTNFKANHNPNLLSTAWVMVVFTNAKILILKLITTHVVFSFCPNRCIYQCKDTNFKANHNLSAKFNCWPSVVFTNAKILILKLITTASVGLGALNKLYLPMQRY